MTKIEERRFTASAHLATALLFGDPVDHEEDLKDLRDIEKYELAGGFRVVDAGHTEEDLPDYGLWGDVCEYTAIREVEEAS